MSEHETTQTLEEARQQLAALERRIQVEDALERVRARTMAMHRSEELADVIAVVFAQFHGLAFEADSCAIQIIQEETRDLHVWISNINRPQIFLSFPSRFWTFEHPVATRLMEALEKEEPFFTDTFTRQEKNSYFAWLYEHTGFKQVPEDRKAYLMDSPGMTRSVALTAPGSLAIYKYDGEPFSEEENAVLRRFAKVFEQTYTRFLDLKKAEAQAREAQVEAALERIRARTMEMHRSDELADVAVMVFQQLHRLGITPDRTLIPIVDEQTATAVAWMTTQGGAHVTHGVNVLLTGHPILEEVYERWRQKDPFIVQDLSGEALADFLAWIQRVSDTPYTEIPERRVYGYASFSHGMVAIAQPTLIPEETQNILQRFARVFEQTYTRFLDLKKAEAQAREAQVEAALERVRARAMAMHSSEDLTATISAFFRELKALNITPMRCGVGLIDGETRLCELFTSTTTEQGEAVELVGKVTLEGHPALEGIFAHWKRQEEYHHVLQGQDLKSYYQFLKPSLAVPDWQDDLIQHGYFFYFPDGGLYAWTEAAFAEDELRIFRKFSSVLGLTYRRHLDLQEAEARAREAVRQASLDRVRAEIASMRNTDDLERITPLVWRELTTLGVPFFRCGVFIIDEVARQVHTYLSTPEGRSLAVLHLSFDSAETTRASVEHWRRGAVYTEVWDREQFVAWVTSMREQGHIDAGETYQGGEAPPEQLALQFVPFTQGMLYVGSTEPLAADQVDLVKALADAFAVAYARYEDFQRLEAAKAEVEAALDHLKTTQAQLIQSEKLASLGALTAGIAHEIKNPLNFVNNFSQLSIELADELRAEVAAHPDKTLADVAADLDEILDDLKLNAEKIHHHGRRADGIVRAMMQHARGGEAERRAIDVNRLVEEYVTLSYHGMRAAAPDFNVTLERRYDDAVGEVIVVSQEIGRVFINLLNNAFYAVHERARSQDEAYAPTVTVSTRQAGSAVEIRVQDNGPGIPPEIRARIFEPFFTTKPTGTGTGLGLSISYDIVTQGHGGTLAVESEAGEGTTFVVTLPAETSTT